MPYQKIQSPLAVVCNDAGAANIILFLLKNLSVEMRPYMSGPARKIWQQEFPHIPLCASIDEALSSSKALLSGTGWATTVEHEARCLAFIKGIFSIAVVDHWVNYPQRFEFNFVKQMPDEIWVADSDALLIAQDHFSNTLVRLIPNYYLSTQIARIRPALDSHQILYILEPTRSNWGRDTPGEFQALDYAINNISLIVKDSSYKILIRPHPSEDHSKYSYYLKRYSFIEIDDSMDLAAAISKSNIVIGVESYALTVALLAGRRTFSSLPPWAPAIRLPQKGIVQMRFIENAT